MKLLKAKKIDLQRFKDKRGKSISDRAEQRYVLLKSKGHIGYMMCHV